MTAIGFWIIGIPLACTLVFYGKIGLKGVWIGSTTAITLNFFMYSVLVLKTDWYKVAEEAKQRREALKLK